MRGTLPLGAGCGSGSVLGSGRAVRRGSPPPGWGAMAHVFAGPVKSATPLFCIERKYCNTQILYYQLCHGIDNQHTHTWNAAATNATSDGNACLIAPFRQRSSCDSATAILRWDCLVLDCLAKSRASRSGIVRSYSRFM